MPIGLTRAFEEKFSIRLYQGYGQSETTPVMFTNVAKQALSGLEGDENYRLRTKTGLLAPGLEMRLVHEMGEAGTSASRDN